VVTHARLLVSAFSQARLQVLLLKLQIAQNDDEDDHLVWCDTKNKISEFFTSSCEVILNKCWVTSGI